MFTQGIEGTFNIVTYMPNSTTDEAAADQLKSFRIVNQNLRGQNIAHVNCFIVEDPALATKFGLDTSKPGDLYVIRQSDNAFRSRSPKSKLKTFSSFGFPFTSEILLPASIAKDDKSV